MKSRSSTGNLHGRAWIALAAVFWWLAMSCPSQAVDYCVDANDPHASDSNPGTFALPFRTIGKAASLVKGGDTVFVKAGVYRETVILSRSGTSTTHSGRNGTTTVTSPVTFTAYPGDEGKAIIDAAEPLTDWHPCAGPHECAGNPYWEHIYWADVAALVRSHPEARFAVGQVFQHGKLLPRSRYPDTGWCYPTSVPDPTRTFVDSGLRQPSGYFNGAVCHIKTEVWRLDQIPIATSSRGTVTLSQSPWYAITTRFGYYITSIVGEINEEGEWAYDPAQRKVFLWPRGDVPVGVEFSYRQYCLRSNDGTSWNVVRGLTMRRAYEHGVLLYRSHNMRLEENTIEHAYGLGLYVFAGAGGTGDYNQIVHNTIKYCCDRGLVVDIACSHTNVEGNYVYATGTDTFAGDMMHGDGCGIYISGPYTRVYNNRVERTATAGLYMDGPTLSRDISYNYITTTGLCLSDGGSLYTGGFSEVPEKDHIHHNIFVDTLGCLSMDRDHDNGLAPTISTHSGLISGICVDEKGNNRLIEDNTVIGSSMAGIYFHWAPSNVVQRNTLYGNARAQLWLSGESAARNRLVDDIVLDNILFATSAEQKTLFLGINYGNVQFGQSDRNYFYHPYDDLHVFASRYYPDRGWVQENLTLAGWQALSGYDSNSREFSDVEQMNTVALARPSESRIVYNPTLEVATIDLEGKQYCDVRGNLLSGSVVLPPFESKILIALDPNTPSSSAP
jgi:parallel beta-helix repeat protein